MENSIDSGATHIKLICKVAGKTLIQVIDNGCGMSETDARMSFEKHATSKIRTAEDLFNIRTMVSGRGTGFYCGHCAGGVKNPPDRRTVGHLH